MARTEAGEANRTRAGVAGMLVAGMLVARVLVARVLVAGRLRLCHEPRLARRRAGGGGTSRPVDKLAIPGRQA